MKKTIAKMVAIASLATVGGVGTAGVVHAGNNCDWTGWNSGVRGWTAWADNTNCGTIYIRANVKCRFGLSTVTRSSSWVSVGNHQTKTVTRHCYWWETRVSGYTTVSL